MLIVEKESITMHFGQEEIKLIIQSVDESIETFNLNNVKGVDKFEYIRINELRGKLYALNQLIESEKTEK